MMCEWLELEFDEICKEFVIILINLWVMLYCVWLRLCECL